MNNHRTEYAVIDLGSNSFHLMIWAFDGAQTKEILSNRQLVQIGYGLNDDGTLNPQKEEETLAVLKEFKALTIHIPVHQIRAVGTQVFRKILDSQFLLRAEVYLGHSIDIISGDEEAELIYRGVTTNLEESTQHRFIIDIGGASSEFIVGNQNQIIEAISLNLGCVMIARKFFSNGGITEKSVKECYQSLSAQLQRELSLQVPDDYVVFIGASGTIRAVAVLTHRSFKRGSDQLLYIEDVGRLIDLLIKLGSTKAIETHFKLSKETASILPAGALLVDVIFNYLSVEHLAITHASMREGILLNLMESALSIQIC